MSETVLIDYAWSKLPPAAIRAAGYTGVLRYLSHDPSKNIDPDELAALRAAGLSVALVWETTANAAAGGAAQAAKDARDANAEADALGWPKDRPIYYATDFDAPPAQVAPYYAALTAAPGRPVGVYGGIRVVDAMLGGGNATFGWQTVAWSGGQLSHAAHVYQRSAHTRPPIAGVLPDAYDEDVALRSDWGQHPAPGAPHPAPVPAQCEPGCLWWTGHGCRDPHVPGALPKTAKGVTNNLGHTVAFWDDGHHGWTDVHLIPGNATNVLNFVHTPTGWHALP